MEININNIIIELLNNNKCLYEIISKIKTTINKENNDKIISYFTNKQINDNIISFINNDNVIYDIIKSNNYTQSFFIDTVNNYTSIHNVIDILKILFNNNNYIIKFSRDEIDSNFDDILYISLYNYKNVILFDNINNINKLILKNEINNLLPNKIKLLYFNLMKLFFILINHKVDDFFYYNFKYFIDTTHKNFIKLFFSNKTKTYVLFKKLVNNDIIFDKIINLIEKNYLLISITNKINWNNLSNRLSYLEILMKNNEIIFFKDKLNKIIFNDNFDNKIKSIIINPFEMFKYLKKELDFNKWIKFLGIKCIDLYINPISLSSDDCNNLSKLIYYLINIKEQNLKDNTYKKFINYCLKNQKLIIDNNRINLKIKDYFNYIKSNINLGILAKHLTFNNNGILELEENNEDELLILKNKLLEITKKYLKYKTKYKSIKTSSTITNTS
jgi:hypothetical protein